MLNKLVCFSLIFKHPSGKVQLTIINSHIVNVGPDQLASSDLDLQCLQYIIYRYLVSHCFQKGLSLVLCTLSVL